MEENKLITENDNYFVYENSMTKNLTDYCVRPLPNNLPPLDKSVVYILENKKDGTKHYILYVDGLPVDDAFGFDGIAVKIEMLRFLKRANKT